MKYRILLMGNNRAIIEDMFVHLNEAFELQSVSSRFDDIASHLKYFQPHAVIYCMHNETRDTMSKLITLKRDKVKRRTLFAIVATPEDCEEFRKMSVNTADMELEKPITAFQIADRVTQYLDNNLNVPENDLEDVFHDIGMSAPKTGEPQKSSILDDFNSLLAPSNAQPNMRKHILVVDDDFRMLKLIKRYLEDSYDVATAINGRVALKFLETKMTNLILLDYEMPGENGPAVLEKLRLNPITSEIPVVFLTGINDRKKIQQVLALKPQGYLLKPIDHNKLVEAIEKAIN